MKYLRKRKVYEMALVNLPGYDIPMCMDCTYKAYGGFEWLSFTSDTVYVTFTSAYGGKWIRVYEKNFDGKVLRDEILALIQVCGKEIVHV